MLYQQLKRLLGLWAFRRGDRVKWNTNPLCPYQGKKGIVIEKPFIQKNIPEPLVNIKWDDGTQNNQPIGFLKKLP